MASKASKTNGTAKKGAAILANPAGDEQIVRLLLTEVEADYAWNSRSGNLETDSGDEEGNTFAELVSSIRANGQDEAVDVRPKKSGKGYLLTTGFRRYTALMKIAAEDGTQKTATIKAIVRNDNDVAARARNLRENTARDNLKGPDLAFGVHDLVLQQTKAGGAPSQVSVAAELGKNQGYIGRLMNIMKKGTAEVTKLWRESPAKVTVMEMLQVIAHDTPKRQMEAFMEFASAKEAKTPKGPDAWLDSAITKAEGIGELLGRLEKHNLINTDGLDFELPEHLEKCLKINAKAKPAQKQKIGRAAQSAYEKALKAKDPEPKSEGAQASN